VKNKTLTVDEILTADDIKQVIEEMHDSLRDADGVLILAVKGETWHYSTNMDPPHIIYYFSIIEKDLLTRGRNNDENR
jgi:hypothetical protein